MVARDVGSVQALCERLSASGDLAGQQVGLDGRTVSVIKCADAVVPKAWGSIAMIPVLEDTTSSVRGLFKLRKANSKSTVCTVSSSATAPATHLSDGVLKLRAESCITFDRSCTDFKLSNITAKGGLLVCRGKGCNITMNSVNFSKCSLVVLDGAKVTLNRCCFSDCALGIYASGEGTAVTAQDTTVSGGMQSMTVCAGAHMTCTKLTCTGWKGRGITVSDFQSNLIVTDGTFEPAACTDNELAQSQLHAVWVHSGSTCSLTSTKIIGSWRGIFVAASHATLTDCTLCGSLGCGVMVDAAGQANLTGCTMKDAKKNHGLFVRGAGTCVTATNCKFTGNGMSGVAVLAQGKLTMMGCYASNNHGAGYGLHNGGTLEVKNSRSYMDSVGVGGARGKLYAEGVVVKNARDNGFEISSECHAVLRSCTSHDAGTLEKGSGLAVSDEGTVVEAHDCGYGVRVQMSAKVTCHGCMARNNKGAGYLAHTFGTLEVIDCSSDKDRYGGCILEASTFIAKNLTVRHALYDGFEIRSRSTAVVDGASILWCGQRCLCVQEKADVTLSGVTMSGADIGLWMRGAKVKVTDGRFYQLSMMCVRAEAKATLQLVRCVFHACADCAAAAKTHVNGVFEIDCTNSSTCSVSCTHDLVHQQEQLSLQRPAGNSGSGAGFHTHAIGSDVAETIHTGATTIRFQGGNNTNNTSTSSHTALPNRASGATSTANSVSSRSLGAHASTAGGVGATSAASHDSESTEIADIDLADSSKGQGGIAVKALDSVVACDSVHIRGSAWFRKGFSLHGCTVRLVNTTIADCHELGVHMVGGNTTLTGCKIDCCGQGFVADGSSAATKVQASNCVFTRGVTACVSMMTGSHGKFNACRMSGATGMDGCGMYVGLDGASAEGSECMFSGNQGWAVNVGDSGHATLKNCDARDNKKGGFWAMRGRLELTECTSEGRSQAAGVGALGEGGCVRAEAVRVVNGSGSGYQCIQGAAVDLVSCSATDCGNIGVVSGSGGRLTVSGVTVRRAEQGMCVSSATALAVDCTITECNVVGVTVDFHGNLQMMRCEIKGEGKGALGLRVIHDGSSAEVRECKFSGHLQFGACVVAGGKCTLTGCESKSNGGAGFYVDEIRQITPVATAPVAAVAVAESEGGNEENEVVTPNAAVTTGAVSAVSTGANGKNKKLAIPSVMRPPPADSTACSGTQESLKGVLNRTVVTTVKGQPNGIIPPGSEVDPGVPVPPGYEPPSRMTLRGCKSIGDEVGVITKCGGIMHADGVIIRNSVSHGFQCDLGVGADISITGGMIEKSGGSGIVTTGSGGGVLLQRVEIVDSHETGVVVYSGAQARGVAVTCRGNRVAGFAAVGKGAALQLEECTADNLEHIGFRAEDGGTIERTNAPPAVSTT